MTEPEGADDLREAARPGAGEVTATVIVDAPAERVFAALHRLGAAVATGSRSPGSGWSRATAARAA